MSLLILLLLMTCHVHTPATYSTTKFVSKRDVQYAVLCHEYLYIPAKLFYACIKLLPIFSNKDSTLVISLDTVVRVHRDVNITTV